jgi:hypothetical protein
MRLEHWIVKCRMPLHVENRLKILCNPGNGATSTPTNRAKWIVFIWSTFSRQVFGFNPLYGSWRLAAFLLVENIRSA